MKQIFFIMLTKYIVYNSIHIKYTYRNATKIKILIKQFLYLYIHNHIKNTV